MSLTLPPAHDMRSLEAEEFDGAETCKIPSRARRQEHAFTGTDQPSKLAMPNVHLHATASCDNLGDVGQPLKGGLPLCIPNRVDGLTGVSANLTISKRGDAFIQVNVNEFILLSQEFIGGPFLAVVRSLGDAIVGPAKVPTIASSAFQGTEMRKELRSVLRFCAGVVLLWFGCLGGASAYVRGSIGPWFIANGTNDGFGWKANVLVDTGSCGPASTVVGVASSCTGTLVSATGALYQPYPSTQIFPASGSFDFTASPSSFNDITVYFDGSTVVGLNTGTPIGYYTLDAGLAPVLTDSTLSDGTTVHPPNPNILYDGAYMWLSFSYVPQQLSSTLLTTDITNSLQSANLLLQPLCPAEERDNTDYDDEGPPPDETECTASPTGTGVLAGFAGPNDITLSVVPEPGSIALICGGLLAAGFIRRRQQLH